MDWRKVKAEAESQCDIMLHSPKGLKEKRKHQDWQQYGASGTLTHCPWECKLVQPLWKTVWQFC